MTQHATPATSFPAIVPDGAPEATAHPRQNFVEISASVGNNAVTLTYYDAEYVPRIQVVLDTSVPNIDWWRRMIQRIGDALPPLSRPGVSRPYHPGVSTSPETDPVPAQTPAEPRRLSLA